MAAGETLAYITGISGLGISLLTAWSNRSNQREVTKLETLRFENEVRSQLSAALMAETERLRAQLKACEEELDQLKREK